MKKCKKILLLTALVLAGVIVLGALVVGILNTVVTCSTKDQLLSPEEAAQMIHQCHEEALRHAQGICDNPKCTDSSHDHSGVSCTDTNCTNSTHHHNDEHHDNKHHH